MQFSPETEILINNKISKYYVVQAIPEADRRRLFADPEKVKDVLLFHVSPAVHFREDLRNDARLATLHGDKKILIRELRPWVSGPSLLRSVVAQSWLRQCSS